MGVKSTRVNLPPFTTFVPWWAEPCFRPVWVEMRWKTAHMRGILAQMNTLAQILSSRVRAQVFRVLFGFSEQELHQREVARRSGLSESAVRQELSNLSRLDLIRRRTSGNRTYYRANHDHPLYPDIRHLVVKTVGLVDVVRDRLPLDIIQVAFLFGSMASGHETAESDIDLMVIGAVRLRQLSSSLSGLASELGREINPHVMTAIEYRQRAKSGDHFVRNVLSGEKVFIVGDTDDLTTMGIERLVEAGTDQREGGR